MSVQTINLTKSKSDLAIQLNSIMVTTGVFYLEGYEAFVEEELILELQKCFRKFFAMSLEEKNLLEFFWEFWFFRDFFSIRAYCTNIECTPTTSQHEIRNRTECPIQKYPY